MDITADTTLSDLVNDLPSTIRVLQRHQIEFCCGGQVPIREICAHEQIDVDAFVSELRTAAVGLHERDDWADAPVADLMQHIVECYHAHHREDLPRLQAMLDKVVRRHGDSRGEELATLQTLFSLLTDALLHHMRREEAVLFPAIAASVRLGASRPGGFPLREAIEAMERDHRRVNAAVAAIRQLTGNYAAPEGSCATFRGLFHGLSELDRVLELHVHLEDDVLFRRALGLTPI